MGGVATCMIEANTTIPTSKKQTFSTASDNQPAVDINVATGERPMFKDNKFLGKFNLEGILPARRGTPQIEVEFNIDVNSILTVNAKDKATGKENRIRIEGSSALSKDEIERMKADAKLNEEVDKKQKEKTDVLNQADSLIFQTEKQIQDFNDKLNDSDKSELNSMVEKLKESHKSENLTDIEKYTKDLTEVWNRISSKMYSDTQSQHEQPQQESKTEKKVDDVDYEEVK